MVEEEAATVAASRVAAPRAVMVVVRSFAALPHRAKLLLLAEEPSVCFLWAREGATLFLAASDARFVVSEDAPRLLVHSCTRAAKQKTGLKLASLAAPGK